ncbi:restriction endonuclease subunit S [Ruminococcus albus]|uniref:Type I restriction modification DNA specificity domain protein n=1 Tax=Ruminococcus albus 8 TaxID=246199 RepID=E9SEH6_RUMAL|nr:restriction endonuclease subunit S [Ruminococcus albus]EGC02323.1 type I restriction modification DNA specificity domain protein [Ruminococcus albus 8]MCC3351670.1 restriction endonuclease subunit S [Ruminococcus albus 8]
MTNKNNIPAIRFKGFNDTWEQRKLGDEAIEILAGGDIDKSKTVENGKYPIYANALTNDGVVGYYDDYYRVKAPAVTVTGRGEVGFAQARMVDFTPVVRLLAIRSNHDCYFLENAINNHKVVVESTGVPQLTVPQLSSYNIFFPKNVEEETRIGEFLHNLDSLITLHQRKLDKLNKVKISMLGKMFPKNGADVPEVRFKGFTDSWEQRKLEEVITVGNGMDYKHLSEGDIPVYGMGGYMLSVDKALSYDKDAIGIGRKGTIDKPYVLKAPFWTVDTLFYCIPKEDYSLDFVYCIFQNVNWKEKDESTGVPSLSKVNINSTDVKVPALAEQEKIGAYFSKLDDLITLHQRKLEKLRNIKKSMLEKMFV